MHPQSSTNSSPKNDGFQARNLLFQGAIFGWTMLNFGRVSRTSPDINTSKFVWSPLCQGMQLVSSGYNPVLMQKGMKASDLREWIKAYFTVIFGPRGDDQQIHEKSLAV